MNTKVLILNEDNNNLDEMLEKLEIKKDDIEVLDVSMEDLKLIKGFSNNVDIKLNRILKCLDLIGIPNDRIGYKYIVEAVLLWDENQKTNNLNISSIYEKIATKYNKKIVSVEKAIRKCIEYSFSYGNLKELEKMFSEDISIHTGKINNKKFISKVAKYIEEKNF